MANELQDLLKNMSGLAAAAEALRHATVSGSGMIRRTEDGYYEAIHPNRIKFEILPDDEKPRIDINLIKEYRVTRLPVVDEESEEVTYTISILTNQAMQEANVVVAIMRDGTEYVIKNRYGPVEAEVKWA